MKARIQINPTQAKSIAAHQLSKGRNRQRAVVSNACVLDALLKLAKQQDIEVEFYTHDDDLKEIALDQAGAWKLVGR